MDPGTEISARMLWAHKLRTVLSLLAMAVGVATVVVMAAVGRGSEKKVLDGIRAMGTNLISVAAGRVTVIAGRARQGAIVTSLEPEDADAIRSDAADLVALAVPAQSRAMPVAFQDVALKTTIVGTAPGILAVRNLRINAGRMFDDDDGRVSGGWPSSVEPSCATSLAAGIPSGRHCGSARSRSR